MSEAQKKYYRKHKALIRERQRQWYRKNPLIQAVRNACYRASKKGLEFNIHHTDFTIPKTCPVLGIDIHLSDGGRTPNSPSLDRIDNNKGYTKDNTRVISLRANSLRSNMTVDECEKILLDLKKHI